jgi:hypothetical protein
MGLITSLETFQRGNSKFQSICQELLCDSSGKTEKTVFNKVAIDIIWHLHRQEGPSDSLDIGGSASVAHTSPFTDPMEGGDKKEQAWVKQYLAKSRLYHNIESRFGAICTKAAQDNKDVIAANWERLESQSHTNRSYSHSQYPVHHLHSRKTLDDYSILKYLFI